MTGVTIRVTPSRGQARLGDGTRPSVTHVVTHRHAPTGITPPYREQGAREAQRPQIGALVKSRIRPARSLAISERVRAASSLTERVGEGDS